MRPEFSERIVKMSDEALLEAWMNPSDYQDEFVEQVHNELANRGVDLTVKSQERSAKLEQEIEAFKKGRPGTDNWIVVGFILSALGGILGFYAGFNYAFRRITGPDKRRYYEYEEGTRKKGFLMIGIGLLSLLVAISLETGC